MTNIGPRLNQSQPPKQPLCLMGLKDAETGEVHGFADVASLADFVETLMGGA